MTDRVWSTAVRLIGGVARRTTGHEFDDLMALGCEVVTRVGDGCVCLTFDDGPHPTLTGKTLEALERCNVKATFFCVGDNALRHKEVLRQVSSAGHEIGNHTMRHPDLHRVRPSRLVREVAECNDLIQDLIGQRVTSFRAPYGHFRWDMRRLGRYGIERLVGFNVAPSCTGIEPASYVDYVRPRLASGAIVLLHDCLYERADSAMFAATEAMIRSLPAIVAAAEGLGLTFRTVRDGLDQLTDRSPSPGSAAQAATSRSGARDA